MLWTVSAGALVVVALLARRFWRRHPRPFNAGHVSENWLAEQKARKELWP